ncbi:MAG: M23 family metallopeptidase [Sphingobacteriales bacterium]|nr:MAG: M23 family metallopeptidase [Sphingobacteriales bacterium]
MINKHSFITNSLLTSLLLISLLSSCDYAGSKLFEKHPHKLYTQKLEKSGLIHSAMGRQWVAAAGRSLNAPVGIKLPYVAEGYFAAETPDAYAIAFEARQGEKITVNVALRAQDNAELFADLWKLENGAKELLEFSDSTGHAITYEVEETGTYAVRLQPELLQSVSYKLTISNGPSLAFPIKEGHKANIGSLWGVDRDGGARRHEGIDIFAPLRTPLVAADDGEITRVNENRLGGKVVWLRPKGRSYVLYYAHLDSQIAQPGQLVKRGDVIGLVGNTGNARTTPPHLHFGVYTSGGAVDPLPFVNPKVRKPDTIQADVSMLGEEMRLVTTIKPLDNNEAAVEKWTLVRLIAATANGYHVLLPDGTKDFVSAKSLSTTDAPIKKLNAKGAIALLDAPDEQSAVKRITTEPVNMLAAFNNYYYISDGTVKGWVHSSHFK